MPRSTLLPNPFSLSSEKIDSLMNIHCHVCGAPTPQVLSAYADLPRITSDYELSPRGGELCFCTKCSTLTTFPSREWIEMCENVYKTYVPFSQSVGTEERVASLANQGFETRSEVLLNFAGPLITGSERPWVDFGCGNGSFLKALNLRFPKAKLYGIEYDQSRLSQIAPSTGIAGYSTSLDDPVFEKIGFISLIHVLEHIQNPLTLLSKIRDRLAQQASLLIQVPDCLANPYVLTVADHAIHFDQRSLEGLVRNSGLGILSCRNDIVTDEITLIAVRIDDSRLTGQKPTEPPFAYEPHMRSSNNSQRIENEEYLSIYERHVLMLSETAGWLKELRDESDLLGIFGTSIAASWSASLIDFSNDFWVDENVDRAGGIWKDSPVFLPGDAPRPSAVAFTLSSAKISRILDRIQPEFVNSQISIHLSPSLRKT